jgi:hypothetical protein
MMRLAHPACDVPPKAVKPLGSQPSLPDFRGCSPSIPHVSVDFLSVEGGIMWLRAIQRRSRLQAASHPRFPAAQGDRAVEARVTDARVTCEERIGQKGRCIGQRRRGRRP